MVVQEDLNLFEASEDADEEFYAGGGQYRRHGLEHFPQLWCQNGSYSVYGQVGRLCPHQEIGSFNVHLGSLFLYRGLSF